MLSRKKPMSHGKGFANRGGFSRCAAEDEVGEGVVSGFGLSKKAQTHSAGKFQDEVGEGQVSAFGRPKKARAAGAGERTVEPFAMNVGEGLMERPDRVRSIPSLADPSKFRAPQSVETEFPAAAPKTVQRRNAAVMDMARDRQCLLQAPYTEFHDYRTVVCAHGNWSDMGKGERRKADDCYTVWSCASCHSWLDQGSAPYKEKRQTFLLGMVRQMLAWEQVAVSTTEQPKFRRAAEWALDALQADEFDPQAALLDLVVTADENVIDVDATEINEPQAQLLALVDGEGDA